MTTRTQPFPKELICKNPQIQLNIFFSHLSINMIIKMLNSLIFKCSWVCWYLSLILALEMQKQVGLCEFKARLVQSVSGQTRLHSKTLTQKRKKKCVYVSACMYGTQGGRKTAQDLLAAELHKVVKFSMWLQSQAWKCTLVVPILKKLRQEGYLALKASLSYKIKTLFQTETELKLKKDWFSDSFFSLL